MITIEEYNDIQVGDKIKIVDHWNEFTKESAYGNMDYLLGRTLEVTEEATTTTVRKGREISAFIIRDGEYGGWSLNRHCVEKVIKYSVKSIDDKSLEKMLKVSV